MPIYWRIKNFLASDQGQRFIYEAKSFCMTFAPIYISLTGITSETTVGYVVNNWHVFYAALGISLSRTIWIYISKKVGINYRQATVKYK